MLETKEQETLSLSFEDDNQLPEEATKYHKRIDDLIEDAEIEAEMEAEKKIRSKNSRMFSISMIGIVLLALIYFQIKNQTAFPPDKIAKETLKKKSEEILTKHVPLVKKESRDTNLSLPESTSTTKPLENQFITKTKTKILKPPAKVRDVRKTTLKNKVTKNVKSKLPPNKTTSISESLSSGTYIQAGAFGIKKNADSLLKKLQDKGFSPSIQTRVQKSKKHILTIGSFNNKKSGETTLKKLAENGFNASFFKNTKNLFSLKVGQFNNLKDARKAQGGLKLKGFLSGMDKEDVTLKTYIVQLGVFPSPEKARLSQEKLARAGFSKTFIR
jgi:cell division protein FtsN